MKQLYWQYVLPHALYCSNTWCKRSKHICETLNKLHKRAAYIISGYSWETPSKQLFDELQWPTFSELLDRATLCLMYKCVNGETALKLQNELIFLDEVAQRSTRSNNKKLLNSYRVKSEFYQNTFVNNGIQLWNNLPINGRCSGTMLGFKRQIKES